MNDLKILMTNIFQLTTKIGSEYPELYHYLDENPVTIPSESHPHIDTNALQDYLESLQEQLKKHIERQKRT